MISIPKELLDKAKKHIQEMNHNQTDFDEEIGMNIGEIEYQLSEPISTFDAYYFRYLTRDPKSQEEIKMLGAPGFKVLKSSGKVHIVGIMEWSRLKEATGTPTARYDTIGKSYDSTRRADPYLAERMFELLEGQTGKTYLDIGCGSGNYTVALHEKGLNFIGIDPSEEMLRKARLKNSDIEWKQGTAEDIDIPSESADGVLVSLTIHHWSCLEDGFKEVTRVLKPGGRVVLFTTLPEQTRNYWLHHYFPNMIEDSIKILPTHTQITSAFENVGLQIVGEEKYFVKPDLQDWFLYSGKHDPERYFNETIRKGISSFAMIAHQEEVARGLKQLRNDIDSGIIEQVTRQYENDLGDYLFMVATL